jgi:hypothetical protein
MSGAYLCFPIQETMRGLPASALSRFCGIMARCLAVAFAGTSISDSWLAADVFVPWGALVTLGFNTKNGTFSRMTAYDLGLAEHRSAT